MGQCFADRPRPSPACHVWRLHAPSCLWKDYHQSCRPLIPLMVALEPNMVANITEQNSHFPWQQKNRETEGGRQEENAHLKPFKLFNIHENVEVPIKCGTLNLKKKVGVIPATLRPQVPRSWKVA